MSGTNFREEALKSHCKAMLVGLYRTNKEEPYCQLCLQELAGLGKTFGFDEMISKTILLRELAHATYISSGKLEELVSFAKQNKVDLVILDEDISPHQQRNLEKAFGVPLVDRTELILEVFASKARTKEAQLQIERAKTSYQMPRLKRLWTHLARQSSGGGGFVKGEGEKQLEIDKRLLRKKISRLDDELEKIVAQRDTKRVLRERNLLPLFAIVGYTNAGKSTLMRELTQQAVLVEDKLFSTLDTLTRRFKLPNHQQLLLIDTVGLIRKIPHALIAAFRSTLEEVAFADILLHVINVAHPAAEEQAEAALSLLKELGVTNQPIIHLLNKMDAATDPALIERLKSKLPDAIPISAITHEGFDLLLERMTSVIAALRVTLTLVIPQAHYDLVALLQREGTILSCDYEENNVLLTAHIPHKMVHLFTSYLQPPTTDAD